MSAFQLGLLLTVLLWTCLDMCFGECRFSFLLLCCRNSTARPYGKSEEPGMLQSIWLQRVGPDWASKHSTHGKCIFLYVYILMTCSLMIFQHFVPMYTSSTSVKKVNWHSWTVSYFHFSHSSGLRMVWYYGFNWHFFENQWICHFLRNSLATFLWNYYSIVWPMFYWVVTSLLILKPFTAYSEYKFWLYIYVCMYTHTYIRIYGTSLMAQTVKCLPAMWETWVQSLGQENPLEK